MNAELKSGGASGSCVSSDQLLAFVDGALDAVASAAIQEHLVGCSSCGAALQEAQQLRQVSATLFEARLNQRDLDRIERWTRQTLDAVHRQEDDPTGGSSPFPR